jgi:hypothetical protein
MYASVESTAWDAWRPLTCARRLRCKTVGCHPARKPVRADALWTVHGERLVDDTRPLRLRIAQVELTDGVRFDGRVSMARAPTP